MGIPAGYTVSRGSVMEGFICPALFRGMMQAKQCRLEVKYGSRAEMSVTAFNYSSSIRQEHQDEIPVL